MKTLNNTIPEQVDFISEIEALGYKVKETISNGAVEVTVMVKRGSRALKLRKVEKYTEDVFGFQLDDSYYEVY